MRVGVCSWSLQARSPKELASRARAAGVDAIQLALAPLAGDDRAVTHMADALASSRIEVRSGMLALPGEDYATIESIRRTGGVRPDERWEANIALAEAVARTARRFSIPLVTFHAGFLPEMQGSHERQKMVARLQETIDAFAEQGVRAAFETGQERAGVLLEVLDEIDRPDAGVNFDPANMILYGAGDPVEALSLLAPRVRQIHVKDARRARAPGTWGEEVPVGQGEVDWKALFDVLRLQSLACDLMIERESGTQRVADVATARTLVARELARIGR